MELLSNLEHVHRHMLEWARFFCQNVVYTCHKLLFYCLLKNIYEEFTTEPF